MPTRPELPPNANPVLVPERVPFEMAVWGIRGLGSDVAIPCLVTGEMPRLISNLSGFVESKEEGERLVRMFGGRARLDYRPHEPSWIQVKVGVLEQYMDVLNRLQHAGQEGIITSHGIRWALDPVWSRGYEPTYSKTTRALVVLKQRHPDAYATFMEEFQRLPELPPDNKG